MDRKTFLKRTALSAAAVSAAPLLGGCGEDGALDCDSFSPEPELRRGRILAEPVDGYVDIDIEGTRIDGAVILGHLEASPGDDAWVLLLSNDFLVVDILREQDVPPEEEEEEEKEEATQVFTVGEGGDFESVQRALDHLALRGPPALGEETTIQLLAGFVWREQVAIGQGRRPAELGSIPKHRRCTLASSPLASATRPDRVPEGLRVDCGPVELANGPAPHCIPRAS
jgi:hypothetical protein